MAILVNATRDFRKPNTPQKAYYQRQKNTSSFSDIQFPQMWKTQPEVFK